MGSICDTLVPVPLCAWMQEQCPQSEFICSNRPGLTACGDYVTAVGDCSPIRLPLCCMIFPWWSWVKKEWECIVACRFVVQACSQWRNVSILWPESNDCTECCASVGRVEALARAAVFSPSRVGFPAACPGIVTGTVLCDLVQRFWRVSDEDQAGDCASMMAGVAGVVCLLCVCTPVLWGAWPCCFLAGCVIF